MKIDRKGALAAPTPRFHVGPIASHIDSFAQFLTDQGYAPHSVESKCLLVADLSRWLKRRGSIWTHLRSRCGKPYLGWCWESG